MASTVECAILESWPALSKVPKPLQPMLAALVHVPFDNEDWVFETKWDGFRLVAKIGKGKVTLYCRSGLIASDRYKPIAKALEKTTVWWIGIGRAQRQKLALCPPRRHGLLSRRA